MTLDARVFPDVSLTSRKLPDKLMAMVSETPTLGARIRRARERKQLSQPDLAAMVGASVRAIGDWENDRTRPKNRLGALEEVLGVSLTDEPKPFAPATPDEAAIWAMDRFSEDERRTLIEALREKRALTRSVPSTPLVSYRARVLTGRKPLQRLGRPY